MAEGQSMTTVADVVAQVLTATGGLRTSCARRWCWSPGS